MKTYIADTVIYIAIYSLIVIVGLGGYFWYRYGNKKAPQPLPLSPIIIPTNTMATPLDTSILKLNYFKINNECFLVYKTECPKE